MVAHSPPVFSGGKRAIAAGFREHLAKPVNPDVLLQTLEDLIAEDAARLA